jgi:hypothetical protein
MRARFRVTIGPTDVGQRVTVRLLTHAGAGEPAYTDVVGELLEWGETALRLRRRDGSVANVQRADLVAGRVVPAPSRRYPR